MATHRWYGVRDDLRLVPKSAAEIEEEYEREMAANRSSFDEHSIPIRTRATDQSRHQSVRLAPLRRQPIAIGGGRLRKLWLSVRDFWRWVGGPSALVRVRFQRGRWWWL